MIIKHVSHFCWGEIHEVRKGMWAFLSEFISSLKYRSLQLQLGKLFFFITIKQSND